MTETIEQTGVDVDVDLEADVQCMGAVPIGAGYEPCPHPATWRLMWVCGCAEVYCEGHTKYLMDACASPTGHVFCPHHDKPTTIREAVKL